MFHGSPGEKGLRLESHKRSIVSPPHPGPPQWPSLWGVVGEGVEGKQNSRREEGVAQTRRGGMWWERGHVGPLCYSLGAPQPAPPFKEACGEVEERLVAESKPFLCRPETLNLLLYCFWICLCLADRLPLAGAPDQNYTSFLFKTPIPQASKMLSASSRTEGVVGWSQPTSSADATDTAPRKNILA